MFRRRRRRPTTGPSGLRRPVRLEPLEPRTLLAAAPPTGLPLGATPLDTGEFFLGRVSVTPVFLDSTGQTDPKTQSWSAQVDPQGRDEIDQVMAKLEAGLQWWTDTLDTFGSVHTLEFEIDRTYVDTPFPTRFEPIDRNGSEFNLYVTEFLTAVGHANVSSIEQGIRQFNHQQRLAHGTDWAFTIFIADASEDADDRFAPGAGHRGAFAFPGGQFIVIPSTRSAAIFAHEVGHIFWAMDEYPTGHSWSETRGYYNTQNLNGIRNNPDPQFEPEISIMLGFDPLDAAFAANVSPASTLAMVGWQDSDGDGVFDLADVPLELDADGHFDATAAVYHFAGTARAVPLLNQNSAGTQSDITLNRISEIQYRLDDGPWIMAAQPDQPTVEFALQVPLSEPFSTIHWRAIDTSTGITSPEVSGTRLLPAFSPATSLAGIAFVDDDADDDRQESEPPLAGTTVTIRHGDGSALLAGRVDAADFDNGFLPDSIPGVSLAAVGDSLNASVGVIASSSADQHRFANFDSAAFQWSDRWSPEAQLEATFAQSVGEVTVDLVGLGEESFGRVAAFDSQGALIGRATSSMLGEGETATLRLADTAGRIRSIRVSGHADSEIGISGLGFGIADTVVTDEQGRWGFSGLAEGDYLVELVAENVIHQFASATLNVQVSGATHEVMLAAGDRVDSIRHNLTVPYDATLSDGVTARDALVIINDLATFGQRLLQPAETDGFAVDVNNDGIVSALDALLVINFLGRQGEAEPAPAALNTQNLPTSMGQSPHLASGHLAGRESTGIVQPLPADGFERLPTDVPLGDSAGGRANDTSRRNDQADRFAGTDSDDSSADAGETAEQLATWSAELKEPFNDDAV